MQDDYTQGRRLSGKGIYILIAFVLALVILLVWLAHVLSNGILVVSTNESSNQIEVRAVGNTQNITSASGHLRAQLAKGQYLVIVSSRTSSRKQVITVKGHTTNSYEMDLAKLIDPEPIYPYGAYALYDNGTQIYFADMRDHHIYSVGSSGQPQPIDTGVSFDKVFWQSNGYGVGASLDRSRLYSIDGSSVSQITLPFSSSSLLFALSPSGKLVVSDGNNVYVRNGNSFSKVYSANRKLTALTVSDQNILVGGPQDTNKNSKDKDNDDDIDFDVINYSGKDIADSNISAYSFVWSPDGKYLAVTSDSATTIYDNRLDKKADLPDVNVLGLNWLNASTIMYGVGADVYSYDLNSSSDVQLSELANGNTVSGLYPDKAGTKIYAIQSSPNQSFSVALLNLKQAVPDSLNQLGLFLPIQLGDCQADYAIFTRPIVKVYPVNNSQCTQAVKSYLIQDGLDISDVSFD